jgi:hypothetical protein
MLIGAFICAQAFSAPSRRQWSFPPQPSRSGAFVGIARVLQHRRSSHSDPTIGADNGDLRHYDLEGHKPYRTSLTEQYRRMGSLPGLQYGAPEEPKPMASLLPSPSPNSALGDISGKSLTNGPSRK